MIRFCLGVLAVAVTNSGCGERPSGRLGSVELISADTGPNRVRLLLFDDDLAAEATATVTLSSQTDPTGIEVALERVVENGQVSFRAEGLRLTDPVNGWWSGSSASERVLAARSGETITARYRDRAPSQDVTATLTWTARFELRLERGSVAGGLTSLTEQPPTTEDPNTLAFDFGDVAQGQTQSLPLVIRNVGEAPLRVVGFGVNDHSLNGGPLPSPSASSFVVEVVGYFSSEPSTITTYTDVLPVDRGPREGVAGYVRFTPRHSGRLKGSAMVQLEGDGWKFFVAGTGT